MTIKLYANLISQPSRAAEWVMRLKHLEHELVRTDFGSPTFTSPEFLALNPNGLIPVLQDGDFSLFKGNAIMPYLAERFNWTDLYPGDVQAHAKVNQYLHWHHTNARLVTSKVLVPLMHTKQNVATPEEAVMVKDTPTLLAKLVALMEKFLVKDFVAESDHPTLADFAAYCEFVQIELMGIFDFSGYPKFSAWMQRMKTLPFHDEIHATLDTFLASSGLKTKASSFSPNTSKLKLKLNSGSYSTIGHGNFNVANGRALHSPTKVQSPCDGYRRDPPPLAETICKSLHWSKLLLRIFGKFFFKENNLKRAARQTASRSARSFFLAPGPRPQPAPDQRCPLGKRYFVA
ncbi:hypothetical protein PR002_g6093 [Phytophthora rubi]|uniref:GST N-terminal domain-containing protein n=2 Tax=Phytophthora rubi TaxID=129364 RepID=A0A6A3N4J1_9STRA|nr:hypothetical protein PR002_g6093 [Phytophthora rubi]